MASSGSPRCISAFTNGGGWLIKGKQRTYPTGEFKALFRVKSAPDKGDKPIGRIEVYAPEEKRVVSARKLMPQEFKDSNGYETLELGFKNMEPARIEFRVYATGEDSLCVDFVYVIFAAEKDPQYSYEAEDLFHIGDCIKDDDASGGHTVSIGKEEDLTMPMVNGPMRLYDAGRYLARYRLKAAEVDPGTFARLEVMSGFGAVLGRREIASGENLEQDRYVHYDVEFEIEKPTPISFYLRHFNKAILRLDRIEVIKVSSLRSLTKSQIQNPKSQ
jgi:hypothetical protein